MAFKNKMICNPKTGQDILFLQTGKDTEGTLLEMETIYNSCSKEPAPHYHPAQVEDFAVIEGAVTVRIDGQLNVLKQGDTLHIPVNKVHSMWNNSNSKTVVNWKVQTALNTEHLLETAAGLASDNKTNSDGTPGFLQGVLIANKFAAVFRLAKPPFADQKFFFIMLIHVAYLFGYKSTYNKYLD